MEPWGHQDMVNFIQEVSVLYYIYNIEFIFIGMLSEFWVTMGGMNLKARKQDDWICSLI